MKIQCEIIRDILPLYAEDMVSQPTREMVEEHLDECEACTQELEALRKPQKVPAEVDVTSLKRVGDAIRRRRILSVMAVLLFITTVLLGGALMLDANIYLTAEQAIESVEALEDGTIRIHPTAIVTTVGSYVIGGPDDSLGNYGVVYATRLSMLLFPKEKTPYESMPEEIKALVAEEDWGACRYQLDGGASSYNFWYVNPKDGTADTLLWDAGNPHPQEPLKNVNYHIAYYVVILAVLCVACVFFEKKFHSRWYGKLAGRFSVLFGSIAVSVMIVTAGQFVELRGEFTEAFQESLIVAIPMSLCVLCIRQLIHLNRQDKGL